MHEISVLKKACDLAHQTAEDNGIKKLSYITLEVGELTGYLPVFFEKYFPIVKEKDEILKDAELRIEVVRGEAMCRNCFAMYNVMACEGKCPKCGSASKKILGGTKFLLKDIGYTE